MKDTTVDSCVGIYLSDRHVRALNRPAMESGAFPIRQGYWWLKGIQQGDTKDESAVDLILK